MRNKAQITPVAREEVEGQRNADGRQRQEKQHSNKKQREPSLPQPGVPAPRQTPCTCHDWNALGTSAGASKVTSSQASGRDSKARDKALFSP